MQNNNLTSIILDNRTEIINTMKLLLYNENPLILKKINFDSDAPFLEPLLFAYFNSKKDNLFHINILEEILQGYFLFEKPMKIIHSFNKNGIAHIPELGYYRKDKNSQFSTILKFKEIEIIKEAHPLLEQYFVEFYKGHILNKNPIYTSTWKKHTDLFKAIEIIEKHLPDFYTELKFSNKKIYLHDNHKVLNFTTIETLGIIYLYVLGNKNLIYFIEELIHQGSHNFLEYILYNRNRYFKIDVESLLMRDFTMQEWDYRDIYSAFHGLYTVTRRVECFDALLSKNVFSGRNKHELLGRMTDQFRRFRSGLELLNLEEIFTEDGIAFYNDLDERCATILNKYKNLPTLFDLSNRDLDFRYADFCILNPISKFYKNDGLGLYNF